MHEAANYRNPVERFQGTTDTLSLRALLREPMHGCRIAQVNRNQSGEVDALETGSLYPALHRLESQKWGKPKWKHAIDTVMEPEVRR
jgi:PadR family transcriptional regulator, regulatory protein PadR